MKALSVRQPYAEHIASGRKTIEVRTWYTKHRGPLLIVASARRSGDLPTGCTIAIVDVVDVRRPRDTDFEPAMLLGPDDDLYEESDWCWILKNPRRVEQVPVRGRFKLYEVPEPRVLRTGGSRKRA